MNAEDRRDRCDADGRSWNLSGDHRDERLDRDGEPSATPPAAPRSARTSPSTSSCRTMRHGSAPSVVRIASSRPRPVARISSRFATFAQAISKHEQHASLKQEERRPRVADQLIADRDGDAGEARVDAMKAARAGRRSMSRADDRRHLARRAARSVAPVRSRAIIMLNSLPRSWSDICAGVNANGRRIETSWTGSSKSAGSTPTT